MPKTLLLADDSITIQRVVGITFANEDYEITTVDNGDDAIEKATEIKPDIILADVIMPKKNGYEVCQTIKSSPELKDIPVLLLAGTFEAFDENRAREVGANGHITKPFESQALIDKVNELVEAGPGAAAPIAAQPAVVPKPQPDQIPTPAPSPTSVPSISQPPMPRMTPPPPPSASTQRPQQPLGEVASGLGANAQMPPPHTPAPQPPPAPPAPKAPPGLKPLGFTPPPQPKPLDARSQQPRPMQPKPLEPKPWEPDQREVDFLEPLSEDSATIETSLPQEPISLESIPEKPVPLEPEPLDASMPGDTPFTEDWASGPSPFESKLKQPKAPAPSPLSEPSASKTTLDNAFTPGSLAELSQNEGFGADGDKIELPSVDITEEEKQPTFEPPKLAPAHEFIPRADKQEKKPLETLGLPTEVPAISQGEARQIATKIIEKIAWEIVPQLAEAILREEIEKLVKNKLED